jgi:class 3 adenylate cyclase
MSESAHPVRSIQTLVLAAFDLVGFVRTTGGLSDEVVADAVDRLYLTIAEAVDGSGGRVVKFLGDGALAVWPPERADEALTAILGLRPRAAEVMARSGIHTELLCRMHAADVVAGEFGPHRAFDVIGKDMFVLFRLPARTVSVSAEAFRRLGPEARALLKKHSEPIVYIPTGDPRP